MTHAPFKSVFIRFSNIACFRVSTSSINHLSMVNFTAMVEDSPALEDDVDTSEERIKRKAERSMLLSLTFIYSAIFSQ